MNSKNYKYPGDIKLKKINSNIFSLTDRGKQFLQGLGKGVGSTSDFINQNIAAPLVSTTGDIVDFTLGNNNSKTIRSLEKKLKKSNLAKKLSKNDILKTKLDYYLEDLKNSKDKNKDHNIKVIKDYLNNDLKGNMLKKAGEFIPDILPFNVAGKITKPLKALKTIPVKSIPKNINKVVPMIKNSATWVGNKIANITNTPITTSNIGMFGGMGAAKGFNDTYLGKNRSGIVGEVIPDVVSETIGGVIGGKAGAINLKNNAKNLYKYLTDSNRHTLSKSDKKYVNELLKNSKDIILDEDAILAYKDMGVQPSVFNVIKPTSEGYHYKLARKNKSKIYDQKEKGINSNIRKYTLNILDSNIYPISNIPKDKGMHDVASDLLSEINKSYVNRANINSENYKSLDKYIDNRDLFIPTKTKKKVESLLENNKPFAAEIYGTPSSIFNKTLLDLKSGINSGEKYGFPLKQVQPQIVRLNQNMKTGVNSGDTRVLLNDVKNTIYEDLEDLAKNPNFKSIDYLPNYKKANEYYANEYLPFKNFVRSKKGSENILKDGKILNVDDIKNLAKSDQNVNDKFKQLARLNLENDLISKPFNEYDRFINTKELGKNLKIKQGSNDEGFNNLKKLLPIDTSEKLNKNLSAVINNLEGHKKSLNYNLDSDDLNKIMSTPDALKYPMKAFDYLKNVKNVVLGNKADELAKSAYSPEVVEHLIKILKIPVKDRPDFVNKFKNNSKFAYSLLEQYKDQLGDY